MAEIVDIESVYYIQLYGNSMVERVATEMIFSMVVLVTNNVKDLVTITVALVVMEHNEVSVIIWLTIAVRIRRDIILVMIQWDIILVMIQLGIILIIGKRSIMLPSAASLHSLAVEEVIKAAYLFGSIGSR